MLQYLFDKLGIEKPDIRYKFNLSNMPADTAHYSDGEGNRAKNSGPYFWMALVWAIIGVFAFGLLIVMLCLQ